VTKILIVDDHPEIRRLLRITFGKGFELLEAEDGPTALALAQNHQPDIVILDIMMPGDLDGLQVLDKIKADSNLTQTRVIMVTARGQVSDYEEGMRCGADDYFIKPFSPLKLVNRIKELTQ
jgi:DNA-binding response OmpR family regulator